MFKSEDLLKECSDSELRVLSLLFSFAQALKNKGIFTDKDIQEFSWIGARLGQDLLNEKKKDWEK